MDMFSSCYSFMLKYTRLQKGYKQYSRRHSFLDQHTGQVKFKGS